MQTLTLTNSEKLVQVSDEDIVFLVFYSNWRLGSHGYVVSTLAKGEYLHILIAKRMKLEGEMVDHEDRDKLNNQRSNLRAADRSTNNINSKRNVRNKSGFRFVSFYERTQKWQVVINRQGLYKFIGVFDELEKAVEARDEFLKQHDVKVGEL